MIILLLLITANSTYQVPIDCGCTLLQKTHDFSLDAMLYYLPEANRTQTLNEFEGKGILILRNPFSSIRSYRNFDSGGMQGMAPDTAFKGKGMNHGIFFFNKANVVNYVRANLIVILTF